MGYKWTLIESFREGHKLFRCDSHRDKQGNLRYAIADRSGKTPELCEDGVLWLDRSRDIQVGRERFSIPVINDNGNKLSTVAWANEALTLASILKWPVKINYLGRYQITLRELT